MLILYNSSFFYKKNKIKKNKIPINYVYCGSFNYWHDVNILKKLISYTKRLYALNSKKIPNFYIICNYKNHNGLNDISIKLNIKKKNILKLKNNKIDHFLKKMDVGLAPLKDLPSTKIGSQIKIAEYISCKLKIIATKNQGDFDNVLTNNKTAILYSNKNLNFKFLDIKKLKIPNIEFYKRFLSVKINRIKLKKFINNLELKHDHKLL